jgi:GPH family glycoside/pentoside/hexuronide:cation symporter
MNSTTPASLQNILSYAAYGWALGAVAVPLYIQIPFLYASNFGVELGMIGAVLLVSRLIDAVTDPLIGWLLDQNKHRFGYTRALLTSAPLMVLGMWGVFFPMGQSSELKALSLLGSLIVVHFGYSLGTIGYQAWGAELGSNDNERSKFVAAREALGILGVTLAVSLPATQYASTLALLFTFYTLTGLAVVLKYAPRPKQYNHLVTKQIWNSSQALTKASENMLDSLLAPLQQRAFRRLLLIFLINGFASALPATLVPFFIRDQLQLPDTEQWTLGVYFLVGAISTLVWVKITQHLGLLKTWWIGMLLTIIAFLGVTQLQAGSLYGFLLICILTGFSLGADLAIPAAILAGLIHRVGHQGQREGAYFGIWNWVNKLNLALAPTLALPILSYLGYQANSTALSFTQNTQALLLIYAIVPCILKSLALLLLTREIRRKDAV